MSTVETPYRYTEDSFRYLFDRYKNQLYGFVLVIVRQPSTTEQITHDLFFGLWQCQDFLREVNDLDEYIFTMVCNMILGKGNAEGMLSLPMRSLWEEVKLQPVEYPVDWDRMYVWMNKEKDAGEERWTSVWIVRVAMIVFLLMAAVLAYFSIKMK